MHTEEHFERLKQTAGIRDDERMEELSSRYDSIYIHPVSNRFEAAEVEVPGTPARELNYLTRLCLRLIAREDYSLEKMQIEAD